MNLFNRYRKISNITFLFFILFCSPSFAEYDRTWMQVGSGYGAFNLQLKMVDGNSGWAYEAAAYYHEDYYLNSTVERGSDKELKAMFQVLAVSKLWSAPFNWGYADIGVGLGIGQGKWVGKCDDIEDSWFRTKECDVKSGTRLGIPLQASVALGRYVGLGLSFNAFIQQDKALAGALLTIPLGKFTR